MTYETKQKIVSVSIRFLKAFVSGAVATFGVTAVALTNANSWHTLSTTLAMIGLSATIGGITGLLQAIEKWATWTE